MESRTNSRFWATNYVVVGATEKNQIGDHDRPCSQHNKCLPGEEAASQGVKKYCWNCLEKGFSFKCVSCAKPITGLSSMSFILYNDRVWHEDCFRCCVCRRYLEHMQVTQQGDLLYCQRCGENAIFYIG